MYESFMPPRIFVCNDVAADPANGKGWGIFVSFAPAAGKAKAGAKPAFPC